MLNDLNEYLYLQCINKCQLLKVLTIFLETLSEFIKLYKRDLKEWLAVLLTRLLGKLGTESSTNVYQKLCACLETTRTSFDLDLQFKILVASVKDSSTQSPSNLRVKIAVLKYMQDIVCLMEPGDFHSSDDLKYTVSKIVSFTAEPRSPDMRKVYTSR